MDIMNCEFCNSPVHIWFQCPKKPDGWRPARLATKSTATLKEASGKATQASRVHPVRTRIELGAGTQALPVDTNSPHAKSDCPFPATQDMSATTLAGVVGNEDRYPKRGRPRIHPDRKAYKAEHERKRRAAAKAKNA